MRRDLGIMAVPRKLRKGQLSEAHIFEWKSEMETRVTLGLHADKSGSQMKKLP